MSKKNKGNSDNKNVNVKSNLMKASTFIEIKSLDYYQASLLTLPNFKASMKTEKEWEDELKRMSTTTITK